jgi:3-oxoacyl-[acyl-carrier-protein] synthase II
MIPPTLNLHKADSAAEGMELSQLHATPRKLRAALTNSFGFGGTNASLVFAHPDLLTR